MRIDDIAVPRHTPAALSLMSDAEKVSVNLTVEAVLEGARAATGLSDFGAMDFVARLALMLRSAEEDGLNALGRMLFFNDMVRYAANRLRVEDLIRRHPEILDVQIDRAGALGGAPNAGGLSLVAQHGQAGARGEAHEVRVRVRHPGHRGDLDAARSKIVAPSSRERLQRDPVALAFDEDHRASCH